MKFKDLNVRIDLGTDGYWVEVEFEDTGVGSATAAFELPDAYRDSHLAVANAARVRSIDDVVEDPTAGSVNPVEFGVQLFKALFHDQTHDILKDAQALARDSAKGDNPFGLRIRLQFDLDKEGTTDVAALPWELMRPAEGEPPLATSEKYSLIRFLKGTKGSPLLDLTDQLRVMLVVSNPVDVSALQGQAEADQITGHLGTLPGIEAKAFPATRDGLHEGLTQFDPHVLHYIGHGTHGALVLEDEDGKRADFSGELLRPLIADRDNLRLVFLNACDTAATDQLDPWEGVAASIFSVGARAVVAMQFPIHDDQAKDFSSEFYKRVARGDGMEAALSAARLKLHGAGQSDWATPVMFLRGTDEGSEKPDPFIRARRVGELALAPILAALAVAPWLGGLRKLVYPPEWPALLPLLAAVVAFFGLRWLQRRRMNQHIFGSLGALAALAVLGFWRTGDTTLLRVVLNPDQVYYLLDADDDPGTVWPLTLTIEAPDQDPIEVEMSDSYGTVVTGALPFGFSPIGSSTWRTLIAERVQTRYPADSDSPNRVNWTEEEVAEAHIKRLEARRAAIPVLAEGTTLTVHIGGDTTTTGALNTTRCEVGPAIETPGTGKFQDCVLFDKVASSAND